MSINKCKGIVINKYDLNEADRLLTVFTEKKGKSVFIIKGIRKSKKREKYGSDILVYSSFVYYERNNHKTVSSLEIIEPFLQIKNDYFKINICFYILKIINQILIEGEDRKELFERTLKSLNYIQREERKSKIYVMLMYYLYKLIEEEGLNIEVIYDGEYFDFENGLLGAKSKNIGVKLETYEKKLFHCLNKVDINGVFELKLEGNKLIKCILILEKYLIYHTKISICFKDLITNRNS